MNKYESAYEFIELCVRPWEHKPQELDRPVMNTQKKDNMDILKELVEKEMPKKVYKKYYSTKYGNNGRMKRVDIKCPCCSSKFTNGQRNSIGVFAKREKDFIETVNNQKYCWNCGQRLDWEE